MALPQPNFKKKRPNESFGLWVDQLALDWDRVRIPKIGWVRMRENVACAASSWAPPVSFEGGRWFISVQVETDGERAPAPKGVARRVSSPTPRASAFHRPNLGVGAFGAPVLERRAEPARREPVESHPPHQTLERHAVTEAWKHRDRIKPPCDLAGTNSRLGWFDVRFAQQRGGLRRRHEFDHRTCGLWLFRRHHQCNA